MHTVIIFIFVFFYESVNSAAKLDLSIFGSSHRKVEKILYPGDILGVHCITSIFFDTATIKDVF